MFWPVMSNRQHSIKRTQNHEDVIKWKHFPRYWPFVRGIHRSPVNSPHKGQGRGALKLSLICARINSWVYNGEAGDSGRNRAHYDVTVMIPGVYCTCMYVIWKRNVKNVYMHSCQLWVACEQEAGPPAFTCQGHVFIFERVKFSFICCNMLKVNPPQRRDFPTWSNTTDCDSLAPSHRNNYINGREHSVYVPANEIWSYTVKLSLIGWAHAQNASLQWITPSWRMYSGTYLKRPSLRSGRRCEMVSHNVLNKLDL